MLAPSGHCHLPSAWEKALIPPGGKTFAACRPGEITQGGRHLHLEMDRK